MLGQLAQYYTNAGSTSRVYWSVFATQHGLCHTPETRRFMEGREWTGVVASWRHDVMTWQLPYYCSVVPNTLTELGCASPALRSPPRARSPRHPSVRPSVRPTSTCLFMDMNRVYRHTSTGSVTWPGWPGVTQTVGGHLLLHQCLLAFVQLFSLHPPVLEPDFHLPLAQV